MKNRREILFSVTSKDLEFQSFTVSGAGGQGRDHVNSGVRLKHRASGASGESREYREQSRNKRAALVKITKHPLFKFWVSTRVREIDRKKSAEDWVDEQLADLKNLKIEIKDSDGKWVIWND